MKLLTEEKRVYVLHLGGLQTPDVARHRAKLTRTRVACTKSLCLLRDTHAREREMLRYMRYLTPPHTHSSHSQRGTLYLISTAATRGAQVGAMNGWLSTQAAMRARSTLLPYP